jgi:diguanylate cyclase (GGDEF)-like protein
MQAFASDILVWAGGAALAGAGYLLALRRLSAERRRAEAAETQARVYRELLESLSAGSGRPVLPGASSRPAEAAPASVEPASGETPVSDSRYLFVSFEEEIRRARDRGAPLTLMALSARPSSERGDPDERMIPDRLLRRVALAVRGQLRGCDTFVRYAGDEFLLILPGVSREEASRVEGRIRVAVHGISFEAHPGRIIRTQISLGRATFPDDGATFDQLLTVSASRRERDRTGRLSTPSDSRAPTEYPIPPLPISHN